MPLLPRSYSEYLTIPWYLSRIYLFHQKPQQTPRLCLVPKYGQRPLPFAVLHWLAGRDQVCSGFVLMLGFCGFRAVSEEGRWRIQVHCSYHFHWIPTLIIEVPISPWWSAWPRRQGPLLEPWGHRQFRPFPALHWAGLYLCKYQAISEHSEKSKQK